MHGCIVHQCAVTVTDKHAATPGPYAGGGVRWVRTNPPLRSQLKKIRLILKTSCPLIIESSVILCIAINQSKNAVNIPHYFDCVDRAYIYFVRSNIAKKIANLNSCRTVPKTITIASESERYLFDPHKKLIQSNNEKQLGSGDPY